MLEGADPTQEDSAHVSTEEVRPGVSGAGGPDVSRAAGRAGRVEAGRSTACRRAVGPESGDAAQLGRGTGPGRVRAQPGAAVGGIGGGPGTSAAGGGAGTRERDPQDLGRVFRPGGARPPTQVIVDYIDTQRGRFRVESGRGPAPRSDESEDVRGLRRLVAALERANEILKTSAAFFAQAELDRGSHAPIYLSRFLQTKPRFFSSGGM